MKKASVAIVGKAGTSALAPYSDPDWDIWCLAWHYRDTDQRAVASLLFDIHDPKFKASEGERGHFNSHTNADYFEEVNASGLPVLCDPQAIGEGPLKFNNGEPFPFDDIKRMFPGRDILECTVSMMTAYAIYSKYERIGLYGLHFRSREEFLFQYPSMTYLTGYCDGAGIDVDIAPGSPFMTSGYKAGRYGITREHRWQGGHA